MTQKLFKSFKYIPKQQNSVKGKTKFLNTGKLSKIDKQKTGWDRFAQSIWNGRIIGPRRYYSPGDSLMRGYYETLRVSPTAEIKEIK